MGGVGTWVDLGEGARLTGHGNRAALTRFLHAAGRCTVDGEPTADALARGLARRAEGQPAAGPRSAHWLWDPGFLRVLCKSQGLPAFQAVPPHDTPERAQTLFQEGVGRLLVARCWTRPEAAMPAGEGALFDLCVTLAFKPILAPVCRRLGVAAALAAVDADVRVLAEAMDPGSPDALAGLDLVEQAFATLRMIGPDHPYRRYGIVPDAPEPPPAEPLRPGRAEAA